MGAPGKARGRGGLMPARRSNAAWSAKRANVNEAAKVSIHETPLKTASGQLPLLGLEIVSQAAQARGLPDDRRVVRHLTLALLTS
eukprot:gene16529-34445_t